MAISQERVGYETPDTDTADEGHPLPPETETLLRWLDESNLVYTYDLTRERSRRFDNSDKEYEMVKKKAGFEDLHERYDPVTSSWRSSQRTVARSWAKFEYPINARGDIKCSANFQAFQAPDGSGRLRHYSETEAWRCVGGNVVFNNSDCWSRGFAHCTPPRSFDLPDDVTYRTYSRTRLRRILDLLDADTDHFGVLDIIEANDDLNTEAWPLETGETLIFFDDHTARSGSTRCVFKLDEEESLSVDTPEQALDYLLPVRAAAAMAREGYDVIGAHESDDDPRVPGDVIVRQGEWFFVPTDGEFEPEAVLSDEWAEEFLGNHNPRDFGVSEVSEATGSWAATDPENLRFYARGNVRHPRDHQYAYLGEWWSEAVTHDRDVLVVDDIETNTGRRLGFD